MCDIVIDTETTGLDPLGGHGIVEIGAVELVNRSLTGQTYHRYLCPERSMPADALAVQRPYCRALGRQATVADELLGFVGDAPLLFWTYRLNNHRKKSSCSSC